MITRETDTDVAVLRLDRPTARNALTGEMRSALADHLADADRDRSVRAIVVSGAGGHFCAGGDLTEMAGEPADSLARVRRSHALIRALNAVEKPTIAAVAGACIGIGWSLALACDLVVAAVDARFRFGFRTLGLAPDGAASMLLTRQVGTMRAKELIYTGRFVSGVEAAALGLAIEAVPAEQLDDRAMAIARTIAEGPPLALAMAKRQLDHAGGQTLEEALAMEAAMQPLMQQTADFREGVAAMREKRAPVFSGR